MEPGLTTLVAQLGFPITVAWFCLWKLNGSLDSLKTSVLELKAEVSALRNELSITRHERNDT